MRITLAAALGGVALFAATPAFAQEMAADSGSEQGGFTGLYIGAAGGYDAQPNDAGSTILFDRGLDGRFGDTVTTAAGANAFGGIGGFCKGRATAGTSPTNPTTPARCRNDKDGAAYYGRIGFDSQMGRFVVGVVGEFGRTEINDSVTAFSTTPASYTMYREIDYEGSVRGRFGYTPNDSTLFYATGGPSYAKIDHAFFTTNTANANAGRGDDTQFGITGGGGIEQKLGDHFSFGLEYMYHRYDDSDYRVRLTQGTAAATNPFVLGGAAGTDFRRSDTKFLWHSIRATAAFRF